MKYKNQQIFAWCAYDWANSAFMTTAASALMPLYFASLVPNAFFLWGICATIGSFFIFLFAPILGAIADLSTSKKKFMAFFCYLGCISALALVLFPGLGIAGTLLLYLLTGIGLSGSFVFYDAFLPLIADQGEIDWISAKGYVYGYVGGGIQFLLSLILIAMHERLGLSHFDAIRLAIGFSVLWWGGFALVTFRLLEEPKNGEWSVESGKWEKQNAKSTLHSPLSTLQLAFSQLVTTFKQIRQYKSLVIFLLAFMFYNEGIQTMVKMGVIYGKDELGLSDMTLMGTMLMAQFVGAIGTVLIGHLSKFFGAKWTLIGTLFAWILVCLFGYSIRLERDFWILGGLVALVLGGSQSLGRSLYGAMLPRDAPAEFFGFYSVFAKFSSIWGPLLLVLIRQMTGSARYGILLLGLFFLIGILLLTQVRPVKN